MGKNRESIYTAAQICSVPYSQLVMLYEKCLEKCKGNAEAAGEVFFKEAKRSEQQVLKNPLFRVQCDIVDVYYMLLCGVNYENDETINEVAEECRLIKKGKYNKLLTKEDRLLLLRHTKYIMTKWKIK